MPIEDFTYDAYRDFINLIRENGYEFINYHDSHEGGKKCIIRHDVDSRLESALILGELENDIGLRSTYFVLLRTDMYNVFSKRCIDILCRLQSMGHEIGLHFDEFFFEGEDIGIDIKEEIIKEADIFTEATGREIKVVSMHRPSKKTMEADYLFDNIENSNSKKFTEGFKYLSDSRMVWRENVVDAIKSDEYQKLHISVHPGWYKEEKNTIGENLRGFIDSASEERFRYLSENIFDLESILSERESK